MNAPIPPTSFAMPPLKVGSSKTKAKKARVWARADLEWYVEPERVTDQLLTVERFLGPVWDPAMGGGNIIRSIARAGMICAGTDIVRRKHEADVAKLFAGEVDFLSEAASAWSPFAYQGPALNIVCNPPFYRAKGTEAFIRHALAIATGKVAMFVDIRFLAGDGRAHGLFDEHPPHRIWIIVPRPSCPPGAYLAEGNKAGNGASDWIWLVWDKTCKHYGAQTDWLTWRKPTSDAGVATCATS